MDVSTGTVATLRLFAVLSKEHDAQGLEAARNLAASYIVAATMYFEQQDSPAKARAVLQAALSSVAQDAKSN